MIDWKRVRDLQSEIGAEHMQDVIALFMEEVEGALRDLYNKDGARAFEEAMHFLKGCALNIGFSDFATLCQNWETRAAQGDTAGIDARQLHNLFQQSREVFMMDMPTQLAA